MPSEQIWQDFDGNLSIFRGFKGTDSPASLLRLGDDGDSPARTDALLYVRDADSGTSPSVRLQGSKTNLLSIGPNAGTTTALLLNTGEVRLGRGTAIGTEFVTIETTGTQNLLRAYGAVAANPSGRFQLSITDACSIYTHGAIASDGGSEIPGQIALLGKNFMIGANSDIAASADAAVYVSFARGAALDHFQMISGPSTLRLTIKHDGDLAWRRGGAGLVTFDMVPTTTGMQFGSAASQRIGFFGVTPVVQPAANPDTSGATLANVEIEVNQIKQTLRDLGLLTT